MTTFASLNTKSTAWSKTRWREEAAWSSAQGKVLAVVSEVRARLIYLGSLDGSTNLLNAPYPHLLPDDHNRWPNQGGHRFWLGPQKNWIWPPLAEWEYASATSVVATAELLTLHHPHFDSAYPALSRDYGWAGGRLRCTARWPDEGRAYFGMHVVPVDLPFRGGGALQESAAEPLGLVKVDIDGARSTGFLPHPAVMIEGRRAILRDSMQVIKAGFAVQPLTIERPGGWQLSVQPGPHEGDAGDAPDQNYLSQIWVGGPEHDLAELEQLSPYLRGDAQGCCASTIFLVAVPPAGN